MKKNIINLAIIIPYFKISYFEDVLFALSKQTNQNFNLYIGNDNSPNSPYEIIKKFGTQLNITYKKFDINLGEKDLVSQWHRCLDMVKFEEWVLFLPDDDFISENVIDEFYKGLNFQNSYQIKIFRLPISIIDKNSNIIDDLNFNDPLIETNLDYYQRVVRGEAGGSLGDNIFHKKTLLKRGGFVNFPKAWGSDHATVLQVASGGTIYFLSKARLYFRMSGENISSDISDGLIKLDARIKFAKWIKSNETIFPKKPNIDFYKYFYWKAEYYILNKWKFDIRLFKKLFELRYVCFQSNNIFPIIKIFLKKLKVIK